MDTHNIITSSSIIWIFLASTCQDYYCYVTTFSLVEIHQRFRRTCYLHNQGERASVPRRGIPKAIILIMIAVRTGNITQQLQQLSSQCLLDEFIIVLSDFNNILFLLV